MKARDCEGERRRVGGERQKRQEEGGRGREHVPLPTPTSTHTFRYEHIHTDIQTYFLNNMRKTGKNLTTHGTFLPKHVQTQY